MDTRIHNVKIWPEFFDEVQTGERPVEMRIDDRGYEAGDTIRLEEWDPGKMTYTGRVTEKKIIHVMKITELRAEIRTLLGINPSPAKMGNLVVLSLRD